MLFSFTDTQPSQPILPAAKMAPNVSTASIYIST
jgi:hypothetical protein